MKYEDVRRLNGIENACLRLKMRFRSFPRMRKRPLLNPSDLTERERRDIGLPEPVSYADWKTLKANSWR